MYMRAILMLLLGSPALGKSRFDTPAHSATSTTDAASRVAYEQKYGGEHICAAAASEPHSGGSTAGAHPIHEIFLVPHTHDDTGWQVTVDQYFFNEVYYVIDTVMDQLAQDPNRHFIYVETGFFARWWDTQPPPSPAETRSGSTFPMRVPSLSWQIFGF